MDAAAKELKSLGAVPFAAYCTDPCDGRTQGTTGMFDSLPYRNDAATVFGRLIRSLPTRRGVIGVATCDKGLPAMMMALAGARDLPSVLIPGGVTLLARRRRGRRQSAIRRRALRPRPDHARRRRRSLCRACATPGGGCQFLGTAATSQVVGEALGMSLPHSALAPSGHPIWLDMARRSARAVLALEARGLVMRDILTAASVRNAMVTARRIRRLHQPDSASARHRLRRRPRRDPRWTIGPRVNRQMPRLVDALPNGPRMHPTVQVFLAGGVPEVMLHLRRAGLLETDALTVSGETLGRDARLVGAIRTPRRPAPHPARARRRRSRRRDHGPRPAPAAAASPPPSPSPRAISRPAAPSSRAPPSTPAWWTRTASIA